jgi:protoporphyrin/coproporphyrin ferrochelatase
MINEKQKTAVLLVNVGTPDSPSVRDVRRYLVDFLSDKRVIDIPWLLRKLLVNLVIVPFRASGSAKLYRKLWTEQGSPLLHYGIRVKDKLQEQLGSDFRVFLAMRYGKPNLKEILAEIKETGYSNVLAVPLYPQFASSTTGTVNAMIWDTVKKWETIPDIRRVNQFYNEPGFIEAFTKRIKSCNPMNYDHIIFSYHGLPVRHINKIHPEVDSENCNCKKELPEHGKNCYKATCYETTRLLATNLELSDDAYSVAFQSRLSGKWLKPFTDELLIREAGKGAKKILIVAPSFVADCLETIVELGVEYRNLFIRSGGETLDFVESLNDMPDWVDALKGIIIESWE